MQLQSLNRKLLENICATRLENDLPVEGYAWLTLYPECEIKSVKFYQRVKRILYSLDANFDGFNRRIAIFMNVSLLQIDVLSFDPSKRLLRCFIINSSRSRSPFLLLQLPFQSAAFRTSRVDSLTLCRPVMIGKRVGFYKDDMLFYAFDT